MFKKFLGGGRASLDEKNQSQPQELEKGKQKQGEEASVAGPAVKANGVSNNESSTTTENNSKRLSFLRNMSHGRGGAGNIASQNNGAAQPEAQDLSTPTIKSSTYTTGRGGTGNMARNEPSNPERTRAAQDVATPAHHEKQPQGTYHWGRGGEGNMTTVGKSEKEQRKEKELEKLKEKEKEAEKEGGVPGRPDLTQKRTSSFSSAIERGKEVLGLGKKKVAEEKKSDSAIAED